MPKDDEAVVEEEAPVDEVPMNDDGTPFEVPKGMKIINPGDKGAKPGTDPVLYAGTWVRLGNTENVPEECHGHLGYITFAPVVTVQEGPLSPRPYDEQGEGKFNVKTRDQYGYELQLDKEDFVNVSSAGRHEILSHG